MDNITLTLPKDAVDFLFKVLGELPTNTGVYPLAMEIQRQVQEQAEKLEKSAE